MTKSHLAATAVFLPTTPPAALVFGVVIGRRFVEATHAPPSHRAEEGELIAVGDAS